MCVRVCVCVSEGELRWVTLKVSAVQRIRVTSGGSARGLVSSALCQLGGGVVRGQMGNTHAVLLPGNGKKGCAVLDQRRLLVTYRWQRSRSALAIVRSRSLSLSAHQRLPDSLGVIYASPPLPFPTCLFLPHCFLPFAHIYFILPTFHWRHSLWQTDLFRRELSIHIHVYRVSVCACIMYSAALD